MKLAVPTNTKSNHEEAQLMQVVAEKPEGENGMNHAKEHFEKSSSATHIYVEVETFWV
jgi:hypothetical protein